MTRISQRKNVIIAFTASAVLLAQSDTVPVEAQNHSSVPDARQIMGSSIEATQRQWQARLHYTYLERDENRRRDLAGHLKSEDVDVSRTILVNGVPFDQLVEHNGRPPSVGEERKQKEELDKLKRETPEQRAERLRKQEEENASIVREVPKPSTSSLSAKKQLTADRRMYCKRHRIPATMPKASTAICFPRSQVSFGSTSKTLGGLRLTDR
jgi:hypothetical protein